jgi:hypothetical protein
MLILLSAFPDNLHGAAKLPAVLAEPRSPTRWPTPTLGLSGQLQHQGGDKESAPKESFE